MYKEIASAQTLAQSPHPRKDAPVVALRYVKSAPRLSSLRALLFGEAISRYEAENLINVRPEVALTSPESELKPVGFIRLIRFMYALSREYSGSILPLAAKDERRMQAINNRQRAIDNRQGREGGEAERAVRQRHFDKAQWKS